MSKPVTTFRFIEFNPRRAFRGAAAVRMGVIEDGEEGPWLWMSEKDIRNNIKEFGDSEELQAGLRAYKKPAPQPEQRDE